MACYSALAVERLEKRALRRYLAMFFAKAIGGKERIQSCSDQKANDFPTGKFVKIWGALLP